jgi:hypothetical protein
METMQLETGMLIEFEYPAANFRGVRPRWERRRLRVDRVRAINTEPLAPLTLELEPLLSRGKVLVTGLDLDKGRERSFYAEQMREVRECEHLPLEPHVVVLLDDSSDSSPELVHAATCGDEAIAFAREWLREALGFTVGIRRVG